MTIGERIAKARDACGLTQTMLAQRLGLAQGTVSHWESGRSDISAAQLVAVAGQLRVSPAVLLGSGGADIAAKLDLLDSLRRTLDDFETRLRASDRPHGD